MPPRRPRLVLFPGLGVDGRLFRPQLALPADVRVPAWLPPVDRESLPDYARRLAATVTPGDDLFLGGVSLGGMVALEAARHLRPRGVFLVASCHSHRQLAPIIRLACAVAPHLPLAAIRLAIYGSPLGLEWIGRFDRHQRRLFLELADTADPNLFRWGAGAISRWEFCQTLSCPVYQIHGTIDPVIPPQGVRPDALVPNGGHLVNLTHPSAVNAFIAERLARP